MTRQGKPKRARKAAREVLDSSNLKTKKLLRKVWGDKLEACGSERGGCQCGMIYSTKSDGVMATVTVGKWGDSWPSLRFVKNWDYQPGEGSIMPKIEPYLEHDYYGEVSKPLAFARMERLVACWNALRGIDDPAAFVLEAKRALAVVR